jgi:hypothetical protein
MNKLLRTSTLLIGFFFLSGQQNLKAQFLMDMVDTTTDMGKGMLSIYKKYDKIRISGYMQPQFQKFKLQVQKVIVVAISLPMLIAAL